MRYRSVLMRNKKIALLLTIMIPIMLAYCILFIGLHKEHQCSGKGCPICHELQLSESIIRAKGYLWFNDDPMHVQLFEQAGRNSSLTELSNWTAALPKKDQEEMFTSYPDILD